jgi:pseudomonalisin/xanthomonalisin
VAGLAAGLIIAPGALAAPSGLSALRLHGATRTGTLQRAHVPVTLSLKPRHAAGLKKAAARGAGLEPAVFNRRFAPSKATVSLVRAWARSQQLRVESVSSNRLLVRVTGSASQVSRAFGTRLRSYRAGSTRFFAPGRRASLPRRIGTRTNAVLGLSNLGHAEPRQLPLPSQVGTPSTYGPKELAALYNAPASATGAGQHVAVIAEGDLTQPRKDLVTFEDKFGLPHVTWNQIQVGAPSSDTSGADEWDLDTQYSTGMAPDVSQLDVYDGASLSNDDILATINRWVTDDQSRQGSFSAGECEVLAFATGFTDALDVVLQQAAAQGQTLFLSSGDSGIFCTAVVGVNGVPAGVPSVEYPAASPNAIGVGGTTVLGPGPSEVAWYAGGGGSSDVEPTPSWQQNGDRQRPAGDHRRYERERSGLAGHLGPDPGRQGRRPRLRRPGDLRDGARERVPRHRGRRQRRAGDAGMGLHHGSRHARHQRLRRGGLAGGSPGAEITAACGIAGRRRPRRRLGFSLR